MDEFRNCPYCGEQIRGAATRCRYCRSRLTALDPERWYRDHPERRVAGVASAVARALAFPVGAVRLGFIVLTFIHLLGPLVYGALWLLIPFAPDGDAPLGRLFAMVRDLFDVVRDTLDGRERREPPRHDDAERRDPETRGNGSHPTSLPVQHLTT